MLIGAPKVSHDGDEVVISARVEIGSGNELPEVLWFRVPREAEDLISPRADAFAAALALLAASRGEPLSLRAPLSPRLGYGLREYLRAFSGWFPLKFSVVEVRGEGYVPAIPPSDGVTMTAFTGGVDSFYTVWDHLPDRLPVPRACVEYALFVHGFDIPLADTQTYRVACETYDPILRRAGVRLLRLSTNARDFLREIPWEPAHGAPVAAAALILSAGTRRLLVPTGSVYDTTLPHGTDHRVVHWLSTEALESVAFGMHADRSTKIAALAGWPETYGALRVCWERPDGVRNCGRCEKCLRTMISLELCGGLERYTTFNAALTPETIAGLRLVTDVERLYMIPLARQARAAGRTDLARAIEKAIRRGTHVPCRRRATDWWDRLWQRIVRQV